MYDYAIPDRIALSKINIVDFLKSFCYVYGRKIFMYRCKRCQKEFDSYERLKRHARKFHNIDSISFHVEYHLGDEWPQCKCGCNGKVKWSYQLKGFREFCKGHVARVRNNWGHNPRAIEKSAETRRQQYASGEREQWNKGFTKETNESIKKYGKSISRAFTISRKKEYSKRMKQNRRNGTIPDLKGPHHSQWNGGTSSVSMLVYNDVRFYEEWKRPILVRDRFKCVECGNTKDLHVHHNVEMLCEIIKKHVGNGIDTSNHELKRSIADAVVDYHVKNKVSGVTICRGCHGKIHPSLNFV